MSDMDLQARRDAAKADARAKRAADAAEELRQKLEGPVAVLTQAVLVLITALKQKGVLDATDLQAEVSQLKQIQTMQTQKNPFDFS